MHVGIDTVRLSGEGFRTRVAEGDAGRGRPCRDHLSTLMRFRAHGLSAICPVVVLGSQAGSAQPPAVTGPIQAGALMFSWAAS